MVKCTHFLLRRRRDFLFLKCFSVSSRVFVLLDILVTEMNNLDGNSAYISCIVVLVECGLEEKVKVNGKYEDIVI